MPNSIFFFPKGGQPFLNLRQTAKVKTSSTKIECAMLKLQKTKIRGRVVVNKSLNKMLI